MNSTCHFQSALASLRAFHLQAMTSAPDGIYETIIPKLQVLRAALQLPQAALPILLAMSRSASGPAFKQFVENLGRAFLLGRAHRGAVFGTWPGTVPFTN